MREYCSTPNEDPEEHVYVLHGVLVHSGDIDGGHYFALLKPEKDGKWFRFDDDRVTPVTLREVFEDNYGDIEASDDDEIRCTSAKSLRRFTNAYMLVYFQKNKLNEILETVKEEEIPKHLSKSVKDNARALKDDVINTLLQQQQRSPKKDIRLKKSNASDKKCNIM